jgi:SNF2 family DNA or RNA helicase
MMKLMRVVSHPSLIQGLEHLPANNRHNEKIVEFVSRALTPGLLRELGGVYQARDFLTACNPSQSGKMMALKLLLEMFTASSEKVLVFSHSTRVLDLIEKFIKASGWSYCRLDGTTVGTQRQGIIDRYNNDKSLLIFLLSTKAGGLGINLTSASKVIQFDVLWNPSGDRQVSTY